MSNKNQFMMKLNLLAALLLSTLAFAGCKDECKDVNCGANGACVEGNCVCDAGYLGTNCETALNSKFGGVYNSDPLTCSASGTFPHDDVTFAPKAGSPTDVIVSGLYYQGAASVTAVVGANGQSFSIAKQSLGSSAYEIKSTSGSITADGKTITLAYEVYQMDTVLLESCTATFTR
jgi:hypothetical protein